MEDQRYNRFWPSRNALDKGLDQVDVVCGRRMPLNMRFTHFLPKEERALIGSSLEAL